MATFKHISSKNADYGAAEAYLTFEHDEFTMKATLDENGRLIPREDYRISSLNCGGEDFAVACMRANLRYEKNQKREDVKSHHYIISFDPRDGTDNGLTVGFIDRDRLPFKIEICRGQRQQFSLTDAAPIQHFKGIERNRLVHHFFGKFLVFLLRPEKHFSCLGLSHIADLGSRVVFQPIEFHGVIENCTELIVQSFEIYRRICLAALIPTFDHLILPSDNVFGLDRVHFPLGEVGKQFGADDMLLGVPSVLFQPVLHIGCVGVDKALKGHIQISFYLVELFPLPSKSFSFGWKASLRRLVDFALPIRKTVVDLPSVVLGIFVN